MKFILNRTKAIVFLVYLLLAFMCFRGVIFQQGVFGGKGDWFMPSYRSQYINQHIAEKYAISSSGNAVSMPFGWTTSESVFYLLSLIGFGGGFITKLSMFCLFFLAGYAMFCFLNSYITKNVFAGFLGGVICMMNPIVFNMIVMGHINMLVAYSLFPFYLSLVHGMHKKIRFGKFVEGGLLLGFILSDIHYIMIILLFDVLYVLVAGENMKIRLIKSFGIILLIGIMVQFLPFALRLLGTTSTLSTLGSSTIHWTWYKAPNIINTFGFQVPTTHYYNTMVGIGLFSVFIVASLLIILISISSVFIKKDKKIIVYTIIFILGVMIYTGNNAPFSLITGTMFDKFPLFFGFFRTTSRIGLIMIPAISVMFTLVIARLDKKKLSYRFGVLAIVALFSFGFFTGNFGDGYGKAGLIPYELPEQYSFLYEDYLGMSNDYRILMLPMVQPLVYPNASNAQGPDPLLMSGALIPHFGNYLNSQLEKHILLRMYHTEEGISEFLDRYSVRYIIYRKDFESVAYRYMYPSFPNDVSDNKMLLLKLEADKGIELIEENSHYAVFENLEYSPFVSAAVRSQGFESFDNMDDDNVFYIEEDDDSISPALDPTNTDANKGWAEFSNWYFWESNYKYLPSQGLITTRDNAVLRLDNVPPGLHDIVLEIMTCDNIMEVVSGNNNLTVAVNQTDGFDVIRIDDFDISGKGGLFLSFKNGPVAIEKVVIDEIDTIDDSFWNINGTCYPDINFSKVNPSRYIVSVSGADESYILKMNEEFSKSWILTSSNEVKSSFMDFLSDKIRFFKKENDLAPHTICDGYSNCWHIDPKVFGESHTFELYYKPQDIFDFGYLISYSSILLCVVLIIIGKIFDI